MSDKQPKRINERRAGISCRIGALCAFRRRGMALVVRHTDDIRGSMMVQGVGLGAGERNVKDEFTPPQVCEMWQVARFISLAAPSMEKKHVARTGSTHPVTMM